ncbi:hypothetical protein [Sphingomonas baiyangensis]|uniref:Uncharacterized protein n=1 Tax=Sphingomonas baiyangensis TaxID=2572576 RepID=A0A4U1L1T1_9SPHN|nr:hypothetical protein [Sphingomonas baiyangensis]TKD50542.1 hypothetical protein FBR43_07035 [Sphingomonas baiyangensis]
MQDRSDPSVEVLRNLADTLSVVPDDTHDKAYFGLDMRHGDARTIRSAILAVLAAPPVEQHRASTPTVGREVEVARILALSDDEIMAEADASDVAWARAFKLGLALGEKAAANPVREALAWYGEQARLCRLIHSEGDAGRQALAADGGKRADAILALHPPAMGEVEQA